MQAYEDSIKEYSTVYLDNLMGFSPSTIRRHALAVRHYLRWLHCNGIDLPQMDSCRANDYLNLLGDYQQYNALFSLRHYHRYLQMMGLPGGELDLFEHVMRRKPAQRPYPYYSPAKIECLLAAPDTSTLIGLRDRCILQTLYDTGMRNSELRNLQISDVDFTQGYIRIMGKGSKERLMPITQVLSDWLHRWLQRRSELLIAPNPYLFVPICYNNAGEYLALSTLNAIVKKYTSVAGIDRGFTVHTLRHCFASHMLENGANIMAVKEMLGHEDLSATQIYLQFGKSRLQSLHRKYHPRADWPDSPPRDGQ